MFCLALAYVAVVVLVTKVHSLPTKDPVRDAIGDADKSEGDTDTSKGDSNKKTFKDTLRKAKDKQAVRNYVSPVRKHHLDLELGAGVEPVKLVDLDGGDSIVAITEDPPANEHPTPNSILTAYLEPLNYDDLKIQPLPVRQTAQADLLKPVQ